MRIARFVAEGRVKFGVIQGRGIRSLKHSPFTRQTEIGLDGSSYRLDRVRLLAPCRPGKIVAVGVNYRSHAAEVKIEPRPVPLLFLKPSTAVIGPEEPIVTPLDATRVDYEGELGIVIGKQARDVPLNKVTDYILGYTCFNDVTERDIQTADGQWTRAKGFDTFAPIGPWIETAVDPNDLKIETYLNGKVRQSGRTSELIFGIPQLVSFISGVMTLLPGDVIATGTPEGIGPMKPGDIVEVIIEGIGTLKNPVAAHK